MRHRLPLFDEFINEGLKYIGKREVTAADKKTTFRDPVPLRHNALMNALQPETKFEDKQGYLYKVLSNDGNSITFVLLNARGDETQDIKTFPADTLTKLFINRTYFLTSREKMVNIK